MVTDRNEPFSKSLLQPLSEDADYPMQCSLVLDYEVQLFHSIHRPET